MSGTSAEQTEHDLRVDLAASYRLMALYGWDELVFTHISMRIPGPDHHFLINPYGMLFEEITASSLIKIDLDGNKLQDSPWPVNPAGFVIHSAIHAAREDARSRRLMDLPGIGPNTASALLASIGGGHDFKNGRQVAAWIGLTPGQYSSGGTTRLGRITKAGDRYLRSLLVMGAKAILSGLGEKQDRFSRWARSLVERRGYWKAVVAIAAKNARLAWAVLRFGEDFRLKAAADRMA